MTRLYQQRNNLIKHKKVFLNLILHNKEPKQLKKTANSLTRRDIGGLITFLRLLYGGKLELNNNLQFLLKNKRFVSLERLYAEQQLHTLYDKATLSFYLPIVAQLLESLY